MQDFFRNLFGSKNRYTHCFLVIAVRRKATALPQKDPLITCSGTFKPGIAEPVSGREMSGSDYKLLRLQEQTQEIRTRSVILVGSKLCETSSI